MKQRIEDILKEAAEVNRLLLGSQADVIRKTCNLILGSIKKGGKVIIFGNGGSAADSQHIAAELMGRFKKDRSPLAAIALTTNTSTLTAISNDYGYALCFKRQLEGIAKKEDIAIGISTSGNAANVNEAILKAKEMGLATIGFTGADGGTLAKTASLVIKIPSKNTPRIQEAHILVGHIICELLEERYALE